MAKTAVTRVRLCEEDLSVIRTGARVAGVPVSEILRTGAVALAKHIIRDGGAQAQQEKPKRGRR